GAVPLRGAGRGSARRAGPPLRAPLPPFLLRTADNPQGVPQGVCDGLVDAVGQDRDAYFKQFFDDFSIVDTLGGSRIGDEAWRASFQAAVAASASATLACVPAWLTALGGPPRVAAGGGRGPAEGRRAAPGGRGGGGRDPADRRRGAAPAGAAPGPHLRGDRRRAAPHRLDACRRGQPRPARLPRAPTLA